MATSDSNGGSVRRFWAGIICVGAAVLGWAAIIIVSWVAPGGHPPLAAYVAVPILVGLLPVNLVGAILSFMAARTVPRPQPRLVAWLSVAANLVFLFLGLRGFLRG